MSQPTSHGDNIVQQIQTEDAYGDFNVLTLADVWNIVDNIHTQIMDQSVKEHLKELNMLESWMRQLEDMDNELPPL